MPHHSVSPLLSRRSFLRRSGLAGVAWGVAPAIVGLNRTFAAERKQGKLGVALVGLGGFSTMSIAPELPSAKNVYLAAVVTGDPTKKGREWAAKYGFPEKNIYNYETFDQIANNPDIDVVHVVLPNSMHAEFAIRAAKAGKHVMCEKPMAISSAQCHSMIEAARTAGVQLGMSYRLHFEPHHQEMMRLAREKTYGEVKGIMAEFSWRRRDNKPWLLDRAMAGGGALFDTGVYPIQAGCYITNEVPVRASALATSTRDVYSPGVEETMSFTLEFPGGAVMSGRASYAHAAHQLTVAGETGVFACTPGPTGGSVFGQSSRGNPNPKQVVLPQNKTFKRDDTLQLAVLHDEFAAAIREQRPFAYPGEMGLRDVQIVEALYASVAQNGKVVIVKT